MMRFKLPILKISTELKEPLKGKKKKRKKNI